MARPERREGQGGSAHRLTRAGGEERKLNLPNSLPGIPPVGWSRMAAARELDHRLKDPEVSFQPFCRGWQCCMQFI